MATQAVLKYLQETNRPYSANDIVQNMHKEYSKTQIQKSLDELVADGRIFEKVYGKQKVYCIKQEDMVADNDDELTELNSKEIELDDMISSIVVNLESAETSMKSMFMKLSKQRKTFEPETLREINKKLDEMLEMLKTRKISDHAENISASSQLLSSLKGELSSLESDLKSILSEPTTEEALEESKRLEEMNTRMQDKIKLLKESTNLIPEKEKTAITKGKSTNLNEYKKRKRICLNVIDEILENYPKSKKSLLEEIGVDQDGDSALDKIQS